MPRHHGSRGAPISPALLAFAREHRDHDTLSVYVAGGMTDPADRRRWEIVLKRNLAQQRRAIAKRSRDERDSFEACVSLLLDTLPADEVLHASAGWSCFIGATGTCIAEPLAFTALPSVTWQRGVHIAPFLAAARLPRAVVVVADRQHAAIFRLSDGALEPLATLTAEPDFEVAPHMGTIPKQGFHPGARGETQRDAAERHQLEARARHVSATVERAAAFAGTDCDVVVGGSPETAQLIAAQLSPPFAERITRAASVRATQPLTRIARLADEALRTLNATRQRKLATALIEDVGRQGHGATGTLDVIRALELRAVDHLLVSPSLVGRMPAVIDGIVQEALFEGAQVETGLADAATVLDSAAGGIVARLRFPIPNASPKSGRRGVRHAARTTTGA